MDNFCPSSHCPAEGWTLTIHKLPFVGFTSFPSDCCRWDLNNLQTAVWRVFARVSKAYRISKSKGLRPLLVFLLTRINRSLHEVLSRRERARGELCESTRRILGAIEV